MKAPRQPATPPHAKLTAKAGGGDGSIRRSTAALFVLGRMLIIPAVLVALLLSVLELLPQDRVLRLVMLLVCVMPSANNAIVLCQLSGRADGAEALAKMMVFQYGCGLFSLTAFTVLILWSVLA